MTDIKYKILETLYNAPDRSMRRYDLARRFPKQQDEADKVIGELLDSQNHYIICRYSNLIEMTSVGIDTYESERQRREERAQQAAEKADEERAKAIQTEKDKKQQFRHDFIVGAVSACIGSAFTLVIEHFPELISAISSLFS